MCNTFNSENDLCVFQTQVSKATDVSVNLKLTLAQLHLAQGSVFQACDTLKTLGELSYAPGIVSMKILSAAVDHHDHRQ